MRARRRAVQDVRREQALASARHARRSPKHKRRQAVLHEIALGRTNREIAHALGIAEKTVSVHVSHILEKLGCRTRTQASRFAPR